LIQRAEGETVAPPPPSGFLGSDYSLLRPPARGPAQQAMLAYINPNASFSSYNKIMVAPVTYWADANCTVSADTQQNLCDYFYNVLQQSLSKNFIVVNERGPGVAKFSAALSDATAATPGLRSISVVVPQARVLSMLSSAATGTYAFVGSATGEAEVDRLGLRSIIGSLGRPTDGRCFHKECRRIPVGRCRERNELLGQWVGPASRFNWGVQQSASAGATG
jgi:Protein of unknown function (DUF3313)